MLTGQRGQVGIEVVLELVPQSRYLGLADLGDVGQLDRVDHLGAVARAAGDRRVQHGRGCGRDGLRGAFPPDADPGARPARRRPGTRCSPRAAGPPASVAGSAGSAPASAPSSAAASATVAGHRARGVLRRRDRHDAGPADQAERGLDADDAAGAGRARRSSRRSRCRPRAGPARPRPPTAEPELEPDGLRPSAVRVDRLAAERAPAAAGVGGPEVGPLRQVGLAQDHRAGRAQPPTRNASPRRPEQRGRARGGGLPGDRDVVLDQDRDAVQRPEAPRRPGAASLAAACAARVRADRDHRVQAGLSRSIRAR